MVRLRENTISSACFPPYFSRSRRNFRPHSRGSNVYPCLNRITSARRMQFAFHWLFNSSALLSLLSYWNASARVGNRTTASKCQRCPRVYPLLEALLCSRKRRRRFCVAPRYTSPLLDTNRYVHPGMACSLRGLIRSMPRHPGRVARSLSTTLPHCAYCDTERAPGRASPARSPVLAALPLDPRQRSRP